MSRAFPVKGLAELDRYLSALPKNMQKGAYRAALTAAARPIRDEARLRAPKRTGQMARSIKTGSARQNQDGTFSVSIRLEGPHAFLGYFHEYGVAPHLITISDDLASQVEARLGPSKTGRSRTTVVGRANRMIKEGSLKIGENFVGDMVRHPGHAAHPFMRPALDAAADDAVLAFAAKIRSYLEGKTGFVAPLDEAA